MKKNLLTLLFSVVSWVSAMAFTADDLCGVYLEQTSGKEAISFLCEQYKDRSFSNIVIVSKNASGDLEFYGYYKSPNALKGSLSLDGETITFKKQNIWGSTSYALSDDFIATISETGVISFPKNYVINYGNEQYCKEMTTTFTKQTATYTSEGTITATGYYTGNATLTAYPGNRYLLKEGSKMGYTHYISVSAGKMTFQWSTVIYSSDDYCYIYNTFEDEDLLMVGNAGKGSSFKNEAGVVTFSTPFKYYKDFSDEQDPKKNPDAQGSYTGSFSVPAAITDVYAETSQKCSAIYNINGQKISQPQHGLNIIYGRKVIIK